MAIPNGDSLKDLVYVIIAAGSAVGSCVARHLAGRGARLVLVARTPAKVQPLADELQGTLIEADATSFERVEACLREAQGACGRVDGVLNCAGSILLKPAHLTTAAELQQVLAMNLVSAFATVRAAANVMRESGGSIVLMASAAATIGLPNHEAIAAAKAGVIGLMRSAAATYAAQGIRVNAVAPGLVETPMSARITSNEAARNASIAMHPLGRLGVPQDVAEPICWLLGPTSSWVTGQVIGVDGGLAHLKTKPPRATS
jgi:NAD(P)-dependent dehydrogenase (short-subunit alcohol dehydrogenase family)